MDKITNLFVGVAFIVAFNIGVGRDAYADASLHENNENIDEIIVSATGIPTPSNQIGTSVAVLNAAQLQQMQAVYVQDALKRVAGVSVYQSGGAGTTANVFLRGLAGKYTMLVIDGIQVNNPVSQQAAWPHLTTNGIERIEILRGSHGVLYGSSAIGGVVSMYTRAGGETGQAAVLEAGRFGTGKGELSARGEAGRLAYGVSVQQFQTDGISAKADNREADSNENLSLLGRFTYQLGDGLQAEFALHKYEGETEFDACTFGFFNFTNDCHTESDNQSVRLALGWEQDMIMHELAYALTEATDDNFVLGRLDSANEGARGVLDYRAIISPSPTNQFIFGLQHETEDYQSFVRTNAHYETNMQAAYIGWQLAVQDKWHVNLAARHDAHDDAGSHNTVRATLLWQITPKFALRSATGTGSRVPSLYELNDPTYGNRHLRPEKSASFDAGLVYRHNGDMKFELGVFHIEVDDLISFHPRTFQSIQTEGKSESQGVEAQLDWQIAAATNLAFNYTYLDAKTPSDRREIRRPRHIVNLSLAHAFTERLDGTLSWLHARDTLDTDFSIGQQVALDDYHLIQLGLAYQLTDGVAAYGRVENMLDDTYQTVLSYNTPPRAAYIGLRLDF